MPLIEKIKMIHIMHSIPLTQVKCLDNSNIIVLLK